MFDTISDLHKDAYGFRPSPDWMEMFSELDNIDKEKTWEYLCDLVEESIQEDKKREEDASNRFEAFVSQMMQEFDVDRNTVIRWDMQAHEVDASDEQDVEQYFWSWGLGFDQIDQLTNEVMEN